MPGTPLASPSRVKSQMRVGHMPGQSFGYKVANAIILVYLFNKRHHVLKTYFARLMPHGCISVVRAVYLTQGGPEYFVANS